MAPKIEQKMIDHGWNRVMAEIKKLDGSRTHVGWFGHGGDPSNDVAARAIVNEFGATIRVTGKMRGFLAGALGIFLKKSTKIIRIPARGFMKKTVALFHRKLDERMKIEYNRLLNGKQGARKTLSRLGEYWVGRIKFTILRVQFKKNHPATVKKKGSSRPLVDTGQMLNSTDHREKMK